MAVLKEGTTIDNVAAPKLKVVGVGGGGGNAVNRMIDEGLKGVDFFTVNTDMQALSSTKAPVRIVIGEQTTRGLGAGSNPRVGCQAAEESADELKKELKLEETDLLFITAGMGGGTGTGAAPVIAKLAKSYNVLTIAVVTTPFAFEGKVRMKNADNGIAELAKHVDTIIVVPNNRLMSILPKGTPLIKAFKVADDVLKQGIRGISDIINHNMMVNVDFADIRTILKDKGIAHMGVGKVNLGNEKERVVGSNKIIEAVRKAVSSPLLETTIQGANSVLMCVSGGSNLTLDEVADAGELIKDVVDDECNVIFGGTADDERGNSIEVTIIATGVQPNQHLGELIEAQSGYREAHQEGQENAGGARNEEDSFESSSVMIDAAVKFVPNKQQAHVQPSKTETDYRQSEDVPSPVMDLDDDADMPPFMKKLMNNRNKRN